MKTRGNGFVFVAGVVIGVLASGVAAAVSATQDSSPRAINLPGRTTAAPFSDAVLAGDTLYVAGRLGMDPETGRPPATAEQEARNVLEGIQAVLAEADMTMDDLVSVQVFCADVSLYGGFQQRVSRVLQRRSAGARVPRLGHAAVRGALRGDGDRGQGMTWSRAVATVIAGIVLGAATGTAQEVELPWVTIPAGSFQMGCVPNDAACLDSERPRHEVTLSTFDLMATEVTVGQYAAFVPATGYDRPETPDFPQESDHPVVHLTWQAAAAFLRLGRRAPAHRGGMGVRGAGRARRSSLLVGERADARLRQLRRRRLLPGGDRRRRRLGQHGAGRVVSGERLRAPRHDR